MGFWLTFAKKVIDKAIADALGPGARTEQKLFQCITCGKAYPAGALEKGECLLCRVSGHHKREEHSEGTGTAKPHRGDDLSEAYRILGCDRSDSDEHIKSRYRKLVKECHVDSLPKDLPDYLVQAVNARFREVREAYEMIMKSRDARNHGVAS